MTTLAPQLDARDWPRTMEKLRVRCYHLRNRFERQRFYFQLEKLWIELEAAQAALIAAGHPSGLLFTTGRFAHPCYYAMTGGTYARRRYKALLWKRSARVRDWTFELQNVCETILEDWGHLCRRRELLERAAANMAGALQEVA